MEKCPIAALMDATFPPIKSFGNIATLYVNPKTIALNISQHASTFQRAHGAGGSESDESRSISRRIPRRSGHVLCSNRQDRWRKWPSRAEVLPTLLRFGRCGGGLARPGADAAAAAWRGLALMRPRRPRRSLALMRPRWPRRCLALMRPRRPALPGADAAAAAAPRRSATRAGPAGARPCSCFCPCKGKGWQREMNTLIDFESAAGPHSGEPAKPDFCMKDFCCTQSVLGTYR